MNNIDRTKIDSVYYGSRRICLRIFDSNMIVFCMKKFFIVKFITLFCDQERLFESLEI